MPTFGLSEFHKMKDFYRKAEKLILMRSPFVITNIWRLFRNLKDPRRGKYSINSPLENFSFLLQSLIFFPIIYRHYLFPFVCQVSPQSFQWEPSPQESEQISLNYFSLSYSPYTHCIQICLSKSLYTHQKMLLALVTIFTSTSNFLLLDRDLALHLNPMACLSLWIYKRKWNEGKLWRVAGFSLL